MAIWCVGSINIDHFYSVPHIPAPGETLAAASVASGLGGKGANQSVAAAKAGSTVRHIGATGADGAWVVERLTAYGVDTSRVDQTKPVTAHAIISVADDGENAIVIFSAANRSLDEGRIAEYMSKAEAGDILLLQNETNAQAAAARAAKSAGMRVFYSAAPFDVEAVRQVAAFIDVLIVNEIEQEQLEATLPDLVVPERLVTLGSKGAVW
ncbi:MAG: PfkB family carbohydrate kinase, partial [Pseudomonadota bacterium]